MDSTGHSNKRIRKMEDEETEFSDSEVPPPLPIQFQADTNFTPDFNLESQEFQKMQQDSQARLRTLLEVAGVSDLDPQTFSDPEILRRLTSSVSNALDEAASALTRMRQENQSVRQDTHMKIQEAQATNVAIANVAQAAGQLQDDSSGTLSEACNQGDIRAVQKLLGQGRSVHEPGEEGESLLSLACSAGYYELAEVLLRMRAGVEDRGLKGDCTPLMEAASGGYADIVRLLIDHGADVNAKSAAGNTALTYACCGGYEDVVQLLLEASAFVEEQNENGHTPLMEAASGGHIGVAKLLLEYGAGINTHSNEFKESALTLACYKGHLDMVKFLLDAGADQEHKTDEMHTALMEASMDGHVDVARLLLDHGAQVNMPADSFESPLTLAACGGHLDLAALLISRGANLEEVNDEGYTPLMEAAREGHEDVVALLIEQGAYINAQTDETQETALTLACCGGFLEVVQLLAEKGADIEKGASTPLMEASQEGHIDIVKYLLDRGANVHAETATKDTAITYACANGHTNVAALLLDYGADLEHKSEAGRTPLMKASRAGHLETVQFLVEKGANVNTATTSNDHTVLSLACAGGHLSVVQYLLMQNADVGHVLKDNSNMLIEAARGGHTAVACLIMEQPLHPARASKHRVTKKGNVTTVASEMNSVGVQQPRKPKKSTSSSSSQAAQHKTTAEDKKTSTSAAASGGPPEVERPSIDKMTLAEMESVIKADLEKRDKEKQDKYQEPLDSQKEKELQWMESQRKLLQFSMQYWKNRPPEDFLKVQQEFANLRTEEIMQKVLENAKSVLNDEKFNFPSVKDLPRPSRDDIIRFQEMLALRMQATTGNQSKQQQQQQQQQQEETSLYSSSSDASECGSDGDESLDDSDPDDLYGDDDLDLSTQLAINIDAQTESTHDTPLTVCCSGGHEELVQVLLARGADLEHRDKKGCTPLILAASAGHGMTVSILLDHGASIEAMSDRTKDTSLSLACSGGRQEVVDILLSKSANYEHRNVSDYTPLSLAASGGYVAIIKSLLRAGAEINSRTGSKLGISPLMLAAMNGHGSAVKLLLDTGADINAQIETNRNTALTLACFQGRHEVVSLLCERGANVEHRAKTGLTPLMEAASGGYHEVGKVLIDCGADVNALPVPTSRDTALTISSDKGHYKFVELILSYGANVDVKNKKGNSPLWLACNGGHFDVVKLLVSAGADVDSQDNRKVFCLMAAFRKGHVRVVKYLVDYVTQFPSDTECTRYITTISDKEMLKKCSQCMEIIVCAKDRQAAEANKNASILLQQLDDEKKNEESKKAAAAKRRAKKKRQREKKQKAKEQEPSEGVQEDDIDYKDEEEEIEPKESTIKVSMATATSKDIGTSDVPLVTATATITTKSNQNQNAISATSTATVKATTTATMSSNSRSSRRGSKSLEHTKQLPSSITKTATLAITTITTTSPVFTVAGSSSRNVAMATGVTPSPSPRRTRNKEAEGWKEVGKRSKRITLSGEVANYVIGKNNIHMRIIEDITGVQVILDKYEKPNQDRVITLHGTVENTKQAHHYISQLAKGKEKNIRDVLPPSVVKRFNLDAATNQYSIASSLDSFDVDAIAPPASPAVNSDHVLEKKPPLIQTIPHTNTTIDTRSAKKGNVTITTTRTTMTVTTNQQHFLPVTQGPTMSTKRQLFPVQGGDHHSAAVADNPDQGLFFGTAAPVKSCSGIIFSSSVTVTNTQCTTIITPTSCKAHNSTTTVNQGIISSTSAGGYFGKRPAASSVIASKATTKGTPVNQAADKVGKSGKNSTGKNATTKSSVSAIKQASTLKTTSAVTSQHSGSAPKKKSLYSSAVSGSQSQVATTNTTNTEDILNSEKNNDHDQSIKPLFSSPLVQPQPNNNNNGIYRPFGPIADVESDSNMLDVKENVSPKAVGTLTTVMSNSLGPIGRPIKDFRMANSSPPEASKDHGVVNMHMDSMLDDGNQLDDRLDLEVIELAPSVPFPIGTPKNDHNTPSPKKSYSPTLNYDSAFRPIHAPTTKSNRPPLLRTPPGFPPPQMQYTLLQNQPHAVPVAPKDTSPQSIIGGSSKQSFSTGSPAVTSHSLPRQNSDSPVTMHIQHQPSVMSVSQPTNVQFGSRPSSSHGWGNSSQNNPIMSHQSNQQQQNNPMTSSMLHSAFNPNAPAFIPMRSAVTVPSNSFMGSQLPPNYHPNIILATPAPIPNAQSMGQMSQLEQAFPQQYLPAQPPVVPNHTLAPGYQSHPMPGYTNSQIAAPGGGLLGIIPSANDPAQVFPAPVSQPVFLHRVPTPSYLPGAQPLPLNNSQPMRQTSAPAQSMNATAKQQQPLMSAVQSQSQQFGNDQQMGLLPETGNHNGSTLQKSLNSSYDNYLPPMASTVMDSEQQLGKGVEYDGPLSDKLAPIGTERAHKRSSSLTETQNIPPSVTNSLLTDSGGLWSYNATPEVSGWGSSNSSLPEEDQASLLSPSDDRSESGKGVASDTEWPKENKEEFMIHADDTLQSVLGRLSLSKHIHLFQKNEIDLHALLLMKEKDYSEIGLPKGPRLKLLSAIGNKRTSSDDSLGMLDSSSYWPDPLSNESIKHNDVT